MRASSYFLITCCIAAVALVGGTLLTELPNPANTIQTLTRTRTRVPMKSKEELLPKSEIVAVDGGYRIRFKTWEKTDWSTDVHLFTEREQAERVLAEVRLVLEVKYETAKEIYDALP